MRFSYLLTCLLALLLASPALAQDWVPEVNVVRASYKTVLDELVDEGDNRALICHDFYRGNNDLVIYLVGTSPEEYEWFPVHSMGVTWHLWMARRFNEDTRVASFRVTDLTQSMYRLTSPQPTAGHVKVAVRVLSPFFDDEEQRLCRVYPFDPGAVIHVPGILPKSGAH